MKPFTHPSDVGLAFPRTVGRKSKGPSWQAAAVARLAPELLGNANEETIQATIEGEIHSYGFPYIHLPKIIYVLLLQQAQKGNRGAMDALGYIKDFPDLVVFRKVPGEKFVRCLPLELKRKRRSNKGTPGQRRLAAALDGTIAIGYQEAHEALKEFGE